LTKRSKWLLQWRRRYFILKGSKIFFAKDGSSPPHGMINIVDCISVEELKDPWRKNCMKITLRDEEFLVFSDSVEIMNHWIRLIKRFLFKDLIIWFI